MLLNIDFLVTVGRGSLRGADVKFVCEGWANVAI